MATRTPAQSQVVSAAQENGHGICLNAPMPLSTRSLSFLLTIFVLGSAQPAVAVEVEPGTLKLEREGGAPNSVPGDRADSLQQGAGTSNELVIAPLPSRSPLLGWTLSAPAMYVWSPAGSNPANQPWITGVVGFYAENDSYGAGLFHSMSTGGDVWRFKGAAFLAELNYDYYGIGGNGDNPAIPLKQPVDMLLAEALRETIPDLYVGLKFVYSESEASLQKDIDCGETVTPLLCEAIKDQFPFEFSLASLAPRVQYDTRDNQFSPRSGWLAEGTAAFGREAWGSDDDYERYEVQANYYRPAGDKAVIATRLASQYASKESPFFVYPAFGADNNLRGYQTGTYRDQFLIAAQAEYRYRINDRWGAVVFAGVGSVDEDLLGWGETLPSAGFGVRYIVAPKNNVGLLLDVAWGKDDSQFYVGVGEAF